VSCIPAGQARELAANRLSFVFSESSHVPEHHFVALSSASSFVAVTPYRNRLGCRNSPSSSRILSSFVASFTCFPDLQDRDLIDKFTDRTRNGEAVICRGLSINWRSCCNVCLDGRCDPLKNRLPVPFSACERASCRIQGQSSRCISQRQSARVLGQ